jgi:photosystem II stability/assembly factor-like uncharacterized protein
LKILRLLTLIIVCFFALLVVVAAAQEADPDGQESPESIKQRDEWYRHQRAYPLKRIPAGMRVKALRQRQFMEAQAQATLQPSTTSPWTFIGPEPTIPILSEAFTGSPNVSGRVTALAVDPTNASVVYAGGADGGVWKTTDGGTTWTPLTDSQVSLAIGSIAIDPSNHNIIYAGTGEDNNNADGYTGAGILKSTNGGSTWTNLPGPFVGPFDSITGGGSIGSLAVHPSNGQILLAGASLPGNDGVFRSTNGGTTWTNVLGGDGFPATGVVFDPTNGNNAFAAIGAVGGNSQNGIYGSTDAGVTWSPLLVAGTAPAGRITIALAPSTPTTLYAAIANATDGSLYALYKTTNSGSTWTQLTAAPNFCNPQCWYDMALAVAPNNANVVYGAGVYGYSTNAQTSVVRSTNGGTSWSLLGGGANGVNVHTDGHAIAFSSTAGIVYVGSDGGVWSTTNVTAATVNWTSQNNGLGLTQFYNRLAIDPTNVNRGFGGAQDNGPQEYTGSLQWTGVAPCGDGGFAAIDPLSPSTVYVSGHGPCVEKSTTGGGLNTYADVAPTIVAGGSAAFIPPVVLDPSNPTNVYVGANQLYQSTDGAATWTAISPDLTLSGGTLSIVAVAPSDSNTIYTGSDNAVVAVTTNALSGTSSSWFNISTACPRAVTDLKVDATTSTTAYVTYGGFSGFADTVGHVFKTTNGGGTWTDISGNLPNVPVTSFEIDPDIANTFYVGTDVGAFFTSNGGTKWSVLGTGLPNVGVMSLALQHATRTLIAGTHGRSAWALSLATTFALTVTEAGTGSGSVTSSPSGITCPTTCSASFNSGTPVTLTATPAGGSTFAGWSGACTGTGTCNVTMSAAKAVTATFNTTVTTFALSVTLAGTGTGKVTSSPSGITCPSTCSANFNSGTAVVLTAAANSGSTFTGWSGACTGTGTCSVTMTAAKAVTATFNSSSGPAVTLTPTSLNFGDVATGVTSAFKSVTLKNSGTATLTISSIAITGTNSGDFLETSTTCASSLAVGKTCLIKVEFKPTTTGARSAAISITDNAAGSPQQVPLSGTGTTAKLSPTPVNFGTVALGVTSAVKKVTLTNVGTTTLTITSIAVTGTEAADFPETATTCAASLAAAKSCTVSLTFKPSTTGSRSASLTVTDNASGSPQQVPLSGVGTTASLSPTSLNFGTVTVGTTSSAKTVTLKNVGTTAITITSITLTGTNPGDFKQTPTCVGSLAASASCTMSVTFKPTTTGVRHATIKVTDSAAGSPQQITLTGTGG